MGVAPNPGGRFIFQYHTLKVADEGRAQGAAHMLGRVGRADRRVMGHHDDRQFAAPRQFMLQPGPGVPVAVQRIDRRETVSAAGDQPVIVQHAGRGMHAGFPVPIDFVVRPEHTTQQTNTRDLGCVFLQEQHAALGSVRGLATIGDDFLDIATVSLVITQNAGDRNLQKPRGLVGIKNTVRPQIDIAGQHQKIRLAMNNREVRAVRGMQRRHGRRVRRAGAFEFDMQVTGDSYSGHGGA